MSENVDNIEAIITTAVGIERLTMLIFGNGVLHDPNHRDRDICITFIQC